MIQNFPQLWLGHRYGVLQTLIEKIFGIKKTRASLDSMERTVDKLPGKSGVMIYSDEVQIAVWKGEDGGQRQDDSGRYLPKIIAGERIDHDGGEPGVVPEVDGMTLEIPRGRSGDLQAG